MHPALPDMEFPPIWPPSRGEWPGADVRLEAAWPPIFGDVREAHSSTRYFEAVRKS